MTIIGEFQSLFSALRTAAIEKALGVDIPLVGAAFDSLAPVLFDELAEAIETALAGLGDDPSADAIADAGQEVAGLDYIRATDARIDRRVGRRRDLDCRF